MSHTFTCDYVTGGQAPAEGITQLMVNIRPQCVIMMTPALVYPDYAFSH